MSCFKFLPCPKLREVMCSTDRLSALPDDVLCHILSFLPTKLSVRTAILARRWRFVWAYVPSLDLDGENHQKGKTFLETIPGVILQHKVSLNTFRLSYKGKCSDLEFETWIKIAIMRNVRNFDINLDYERKLPRCLFTCKTLVELTLRCCKGIRSSGVVSLPNLKKLHLYQTENVVDEVLSRFLSGCPVLEELIIDTVFILNPYKCCFSLSLPTLKKLSIHLGILSCNFAPPIRSFLVHDHKHIPVSPMTSLTEADIYLMSFLEQESECTLSVEKFLECLCNVRYLKLKGFYEEKSTNAMVKFDNLTKLELVHFNADWQFLVKLLESADNLEVLIIDACLRSWKEPEKAPKCLLLCLRTIRITQIMNIEHDVNMVRYLMRNGEVLEKMEIGFVDGLSEKLDEIKRNLLFERGPKMCELSLGRYDWEDYPGIGIRS